MTKNFWKFVVVSPDGCALWIGSTNNKGYGSVGPRKGLTTRLAHRLSYEALVGPIPEGMVLDHLCRNPACVNPAHLEAVTQAENVRRYAKTIESCPSGHPYDEENTRWHGPGGKWRKCRACHREWVREAKRAKRLAADSQTIDQRSLGELRG